MKICKHQRWTRSADSANSLLGGLVNNEWKMVMIKLWGFVSFGPEDFTSANTL